MAWLHADSEDKGLQDLERGVREFEEGLAKEDTKLRELFGSLKTDLLDEFLTPGRGHVKEAHIRILEEQVRHVISIARCIGYKELIHSFEEEEKLLDEVRDLVHQYPDISVESSPDMRGALERLRSMLRHQQHLIFSHEEILVEEKRRLIDILNQVRGLKQDRHKDLHLDEQQVSSDKLQYA